MSTNITDLVQAAGRLANSGRWQEAERLWLEVHRLDPRNTQALLSLAVHALKRGDAAGAHPLLKEARATAPGDTVVLLTLSAACQMCGDKEAELEAITAALTVDEYFLPALLAKADWLKRHAGKVAAAEMYANTLKVAPPEKDWPAAFRPRLEVARRIVEGHAAGFETYLMERLADLQGDLPDSLAGRWREAIAMRAGRSKAFPSVSNQLQVPRLPAIPFYSRDEFPWLTELEANTEQIRAELLAAISADQAGFTPYIAYNPGEPVNQWRELNHSPRWSAFHLWRGGKPVEENLQRCPQTARILSSLPTVEIDGLCPNVMFSALAPRTHIPPHHGETNARLVAHLPLIVPQNCSFRVGFETRRWNVGEVLIFDDTIEHEARNDSDELRVVLIFDLWNPLLTPVERDLLRAMTAASREFGG